MRLLSIGHIYIGSWAGVDHSSLYSGSTFNVFSVGDCVGRHGLLVIHESILNSLVSRSLLLKQDEMLLMIVQLPVELELVYSCLRIRAALDHELKELDKFLGNERMEEALLKIVSLVCIYVLYVSVDVVMLLISQILGRPRREEVDIVDNVEIGPLFVEIYLIG